MADPRAQHLALSLRVASLAAAVDVKRTPDVDAVRTAARALPESDPRRVAILAWAQALDDKAAPKVVAKPGAKPAPPVAAAEPEESYDSALDKGKKAQKGGQPQVALGMYKKALKLKPGSLAAQLGIGWAQLDLEHPEAAAEMFRGIVSHDDNNAEAEMGLGESLRAQGKTVDAVAAFQRYLELAPDGPDANVAKNAIRALQ
jgi:tetratricopeptide (TPR) repeat protein